MEKQFIIKEKSLTSNVSRRGRCVTQLLAFFKNRAYIYECLLNDDHSDMELSLSLSLVTNGCLIEKVNGYDVIYNWFDILKSNGHYINGFVVMPNPAYRQAGMCMR